MLVKFVAAHGSMAQPNALLHQAWGNGFGQRSHVAQSLLRCLHLLVRVHVAWGDA